MRFKNAKVRGIFIYGCPQCRKETKTCHKCSELYCLCVDCSCHNHSIVNDPFYDEVEKALKTGELKMSDVPDYAKKVLEQRRERRGGK